MAARQDNVVRFPTREAPQPASRPAIDLYPEYATEIAALKRVGVIGVHGFFPLSAWQETCRGTELYMLPLANRARANVGALIDIIGRESILRGATRSRSTKYTVDVINEMSQAGTLLPTLWPSFMEPESERYHVDFGVMRPPLDVLTVAQQARLAGYQCYTAVPAEGITIHNLADLVAAENAMARSAVDPIVYGVRGKTAVVLTHYGDIPTESMQALVDVLKGMDVRL
jgi:hypothetical protein